MGENSVFCLLTFIVINGLVHSIDHILSESEEELQALAQERKGLNSDYKFVLMRYNLSDAKVV